MRTWTKTAGVIFLAAASVYSARAIAEATGLGVRAADGATTSTAGAAAAAASKARVYAQAQETPADVTLLEEAPAAPTTGPADAAEADPFAAAQPPTTAPTVGTSVSDSDVSMSDAGTVEIHVNDANLVEVLRMLSLQSQKNIVASKEVRGTVTANLYDVTVNEALDAILHANGYAYREKGNFIYVYTTKELQEIEKAELRMQTRVFRLFYTPAVNVQNMLKPLLSERGQVATNQPATGGINTTGTEDTGGNDHAGEEVVVVTDYPENLDRVAQLLNEVDRRPQQILLEATILRATLNEDNALGVDFNLLSGVNFSTITTNNGQITGADIGDDPGTADEVGGAGTGNSFTNTIANGLKLGFVSDNVSVFLSALEATTDTTILANPKILALNRQKGEVFVGNEDGYRTTITTETSVSETIETLKTGTRLIFRPYISGDGFIRMEVHPEDSAGEVNPTTELPRKSTTEVTSNIMVKDGHTIVIGGLFRESTITGRSQIPLLGNLPVAGALFRQQRDRTVREEVIILLTPHIVKDDAAYSRLSAEELRVAENIRTGARKGVMPWGRERMAEAAFEKAREELNKPSPNRKKALWHLNVATNLNPRFIEAIEMREQVTGEEVAMSDGSSVRSFVHRAMIEDVAPPAPATMPATEPTDVDLGSPTTLPATEAVAPAPATQPAPAVAVAAPEAVPTTRPISMFPDVMSWLGGIGGSGSSEPEAVAEAEQPAPVENEVMVTELPADDMGDDLVEEDGLKMDAVTELPIEEIEN